MAFERPSGTRIGHNHPIPSDESLGCSSVVPAERRPWQRIPTVLRW